MRSFDCCWPEQAVKQTIKLSVISDAMTIMWRHGYADSYLPLLVDWGISQQQGPDKL